MNQLELLHEFEKRGHWVTRFLFDNFEYGGSYKAWLDIRLNMFKNEFPKFEHVLELGSLEGGHSVELAKDYKVTAIEGREENIIKAKFIADLYKVKKSRLKFIQLNLDDSSLVEFWKCDVVFCVGILYHLKDPKQFLSKLKKITDNIFIWTHVVHENEAKDVENGYNGVRISESNVHSTDGMTDSTFWFTKDSLIQCLKDVGFNEPKILWDHPDHPIKPAITLCCKK